MLRLEYYDCTSANASRQALWTAAPYESLRALSAIVLLHLYAHLMRRPLAPLSGVATAIHRPVAATHKPALAAAKKKTS